MLQVIHPKRRFVPLVLGPGIPRRDRETSVARHARLMLILFKPWVTVSDLKSDEQSWEEAYQDFLESSCSPRIRQIIDNMQLLHECRDSRDD
ncbi:hypothetical protein K435DRAFT_673072, partial [Dendrothele bispora CBS 962.96]